MGKRFDEMNLPELLQEQEYWRQKISNATGWGTSLGAASEFLKECEGWIVRREMERRKALVTKVGEAPPRPFWNLPPKKA